LAQVATLPQSQKLSLSQTTSHLWLELRCSSKPEMINNNNECAPCIPATWDDIQIGPTGLHAPRLSGGFASDSEMRARSPLANVLLEEAGFEPGNQQEHVKYGDDAGQGRRFRQQFLKTRVCRYYMAGSCWNGSACRFAHNSYELQNGPDLTKTSMCTAWVNGGCPLEARYCPFAHGTTELRCTLIYFKTQLCKDFMEGTCSYGESCRYAHGVNELMKTPDINAPQIAMTLKGASTGGKRVDAVATSGIITATPGSSSTGCPDPAGPCPKFRYATFSSSIDVPMFTNVNLAETSTRPQNVKDTTSLSQQRWMGF